MRDFSTPEAAIQSIESAYRLRDLEAVVSCKDFQAEAKLMLQTINQEFAQDEEILSQTVETLEQAFRKEIEQNGFPDFSGIHSSFPKTEFLTERLAIVTEVCEHPDGERTTEQLYVYRSNEGWRVLHPVSQKAAKKKKWWQFWKPTHA